MTKKEGVDLSLSELSQAIETLDVDKHLRRKIFDFLISIRNSEKFGSQDLILRIPDKTTEFLGVNHVIEVRAGHVWATSREIVAETGVHGIENVNRSFFAVDVNKPFRSKRKVKSEPEPDYQKQIEIISDELEKLHDSIYHLKKENDQVKDLLFTEANSYGDPKSTQILPLSIYVDTNESAEIFEVYDAVIKFAESIGFDKAFEFDPVKGSWFKKMLFKSREKLTSDEVTDRLREVEYGIEVNTILKPQSEVDKNQSEALANIITSIKDIPNAAIKIGALIVVKITDEQGSVSLQTRTLSIKELHLLNKKPELLQMPTQILLALAKEVDDEELPKL